MTVLRPGPRTKEAAHHHKLTYVVCRVIGNKDDLPQDGLICADGASASKSRRGFITKRSSARRSALNPEMLALQATLVGGADKEGQ